MVPHSWVLSLHGFPTLAILAPTKVLAPVLVVEAGVVSLAVVQAYRRLGHPMLEVFLLRLVLARLVAEVQLALVVSLLALLANLALAEL